jgi:hypothetical protein
LIFSRNSEANRVTPNANSSGVNPAPHPLAKKLQGAAISMEFIRWMAYI